MILRPKADVDGELRATFALCSSRANLGLPNAPDQPPQRAKRAAVGCIRKFDDLLTPAQAA
jgi:hypothetical protein